MCLAVVISSQVLLQLKSILKFGRKKYTPGISNSHKGEKRLNPRPQKGTGWRGSVVLPKNEQKRVFLHKNPTLDRGSPHDGNKGREMENGASIRFRK